MFDSFTEALTCQVVGVDCPYHGKAFCDMIPFELPRWNDFKKIEVMLLKHVGFNTMRRTAWSAFEADVFKRLDGAKEIAAVKFLLEASLLHVGFSGFAPNTLASSSELICLHLLRNLDLSPSSTAEKTCVESFLSLLGAQSCMAFQIASSRCIGDDDIFLQRLHETMKNNVYSSSRQPQNKKSKSVTVRRFLDFRKTRSQRQILGNVPSQLEALFGTLPEDCNALQLLQDKHCSFKNFATVRQRFAAPDSESSSWAVIQNKMLDRLNDDSQKALVRGWERCCSSSQRRRSTLLVATACSGTDSPVSVIFALANEIRALIRSSPLLRSELKVEDFYVDFIFSCEINEDKRAWASREVQPRLQFKDVAVLGRRFAEDEHSGIPSRVPQSDLFIFGFSCKSQP